MIEIYHYPNLESTVAWASFGAESTDSRAGSIPHGLRWTASFLVVTGTTSPQNTLQVTATSTPCHKYDDVCWERDGDQIEARRRVDAQTSARRSNKEMVPSQPFGRMGVAGDLFVVRRRRCHRIASSSLRDLTSQAPSAYVIVFMAGSTSPHFSHRVVAKTLVSRHSCQTPEGPAGQGVATEAPAVVLLQYVEEADGAQRIGR